MSLLRVAGIAAVLLAAVGVGVTAGVIPVPDLGGEQIAVETFSSEQEFKEYIEKAPSGGGAFGFTGGTAQAEAASLDSTGGGEGGGTGVDVRRRGTTNVQEEGIQEPDILKSTGSHFFYSPEDRYTALAEPSPRTIDPSIQTLEPETDVSNTSIVSALPPEDAEKIGQIPERGQMLRSEDTLAVIGDEAISAYDIGDPSSPEPAWETQMNGSVVTARRIGSTMYLVLEEGVDRSDPCPIHILKSSSSSVEIGCTDIYRPGGRSPADATYSMIQLDMETGEAEDTISFVGSPRNTVVYMSENAVYLTYSKGPGMPGIMLEFFTGEGADLLDAQARQELEDLQGLDISIEAKFTELTKIFESYRDRSPEDEQDDWQKRVENRMGNWTDDNKRDLVKTGIVKVSTGDELSVDATGTVPGSVNDQFSIDERQDRLRVATTVGMPTWGAETENDLYTLDASLQRTGSVQGMGVTERIYSVRYIDDTAYVVTFRRVDPFHIVDLSNPQNPAVTGKLKLPGFSSYLHPLEEDRILGVGEEDGQVKAVIFDVSDPSDPQVEEDVVLDDYHSEISETHHAFMKDSRHEVFFLPTDSGGHIYSYADGMEKAKTIEIENPARARYVNDHLYVFSNSEMVVVDEETWTETAQVPLE